MRKTILTIFLAITLVMCGVSLADAAPTVVLDGQQLSFAVDPYIENDRTLVQMRPIFEALGADIEWNQDTQTVTASKDSSKIILIIGSTTAYVNGQPKTLEVPAQLLGEGYTVVPLRFVSEALGASVNYDTGTQVITIQTSLLVSSTPGHVDSVKVHYIDVGQADCIYIQLPDHKDVLIDGGNVSDGAAVVNYLKANGCDNEIELLIATHPHEDHIGAIAAILQAFKVDEVIDSGDTADSATYRDYLSAVKAEGCIYQSDNNQTFTWGTDTLQILTGNQTWQDTNDYSVISDLKCGNVTFLFTGDAGIPVEESFLNNLHAQILKVSHHGSDTGTNMDILKMIRPEIAIISVGTGNTYGHPTKNVLADLLFIGAKVYRTDLNGTVVVSTDGQTYEVTTQKSDTGPVVNTPAETHDNTAAAYVGSSKSDKYHLPTCTYALKIAPENLISFKTKADAEAAGYEPCGVCKP